MYDWRPLMNAEAFRGRVSVFYCSVCSDLEVSGEGF